MKAVVLAYHDIGCAGIEALLDKGFDIPAVFTHKDDPGETVWFHSVAELAASKGIPVFAPEDINHPLWVQKIQALEPDILFSFYYRKMLKRPILSIPRRGCINLHGSLLPKYRGRCPVNWAIIMGETETGVTLHYMTPRQDDGDIIDQEVVPIDYEDTAKSLFGKMTNAATVLLERALPLLKEGKAGRTPQDNAAASTFGGRGPEDGEIEWHKSASEVRNLVRAVTRPYPGAFSHLGDRKCIFWQVREADLTEEDVSPGTVIATEPFLIACGMGAVRVDVGQTDGGVYMTGAQLAEELAVARGMRFGPCLSKTMARCRKGKVLILGVDGFIGNALSERLLESGRYEVHGMDLQHRYLAELRSRPDFHFHEGDIAINREWIEYHVKKCDIVIPLVAIATPIEYTRNPIKVFELDFEENLRIIRYCLRYGKRVVFPSTSEVYGMCDDPEFNEDTSRLILGPISKQRWIYSCCKQLMDRVIWAYGWKEGLKFTLFRPFNWIGPKLDTLDSARIGSSRAITQLILNLVEGTPIQLIDGGRQKRCFTALEDGIDCLYRIIENDGGRCDGQIINIGNPMNEASIKELAEILLAGFEAHPLRSKFPPFAGFRAVESKAYYGEGYQDVQHRKPSIRNAVRLLGWKPRISLQEAVLKTLDFFLRQAADSTEYCATASPSL